MKVSFILRYSPRAASSRVRGLEMAGALARQGLPTRLVHPDQRCWKGRYAWNAIVPPIVLFQKRSGPNDLRAVSLRRRLGRGSVFDLDDAPGGLNEDAQVESRTIAMLKRVSAVTVGSRRLAAYAEQYNPAVQTVPSAVDTRVFAPPGKRGRSEDVTIGWIGNGQAYWEDLLSLASIVRELGKASKVRMVLVGAMGHPRIHEAFRFGSNVVIDEIDWTDNRQIVRAMEEFDIGIYPLRDTSFNAFKCGYKAIQYMSLGLPVVASPTGENRWIVEDGKSGCLASSDREWNRSLGRLVNEAALRQRMGRAGRDAVLRKYSLDVVVPRMADLLMGLVRKRRSDGSVA